MLAYRADLGSGSSDNNVSAVPAFPDFDFAFLEDFIVLHVCKKLAITLFVCLLDCSYAAKLCRTSSASFAIRSYMSVHS